MSARTTDLEAIAARHGTPVFVYDAGVFRRQLESFRAAFEGLPTEIYYAAKALTNVHVLRLFGAEDTGLDTVSIEEVRIGLAAGFSPRRILFTPNSVDFADVREALDLGVEVNIESLPLLRAWAREVGAAVPCCVRLHPGLALRASGGATTEPAESVARWHDESKFGIAVDDLPEVEELAARGAIDLRGLHVHSSSVILDASIFDRVAELLFSVAGRVGSIEWLDFGGGIKVPHRAGDRVPDLAELAGCLRERWTRFHADTGRSLRLRFEPGRYLVSEGGVLLTRVNLVKSNGVVRFLGVDTGFHHLIRPMLYGAYHEIENLTRPSGPPTRYHVVGNLCETDVLARDRELPESQAGDLLAIHNAGAYGFSMASNYNSRPRPPEVLIDADGARLIRRRETVEDLLRTQTDL